MFSYHSSLAWAVACCVCSYLILPSSLTVTSCIISWLNLRIITGLPPSMECLKAHFSRGVVLPEQECTYDMLSISFVVLKHAFVQWNRKKSTKESELVHHLWCGRFRRSLRRWRSGDRLVLRYEGYFVLAFQQSLSLWMAFQHKLSNPWGE